jgi:hypothetical protein
MYIMKNLGCRNSNMEAISSHPKIDVKLSNTVSQYVKIVLHKTPGEDKLNKKHNTKIIFPYFK